MNLQVHSSSNVASFFIDMTRNSPVNFKLMHSLLWIKGSYQSSNFDTFEWSGENSPNSSYHFSNHKSAFLQILHDFSVSWKITPLYFFSSNIIHFVQKNPIKVLIVETIARAKICQIPQVNFETTSQFLFNFLITFQCCYT